MAKKASKLPLQPPKTGNKNNPIGFEPLASHSLKPLHSKGFSVFGQKNRAKTAPIFSADLQHIAELMGSKSMENFNDFQKPHITYEPAVLVKSDRWYIEYYAWNPRKGPKLQRVRHRIQRILKKYKSQADKKAMAMKMVMHINDQLRSGYNPFYEKNEINGFAKISEAFADYLKVYQKNRRKTSVVWAQGMIKRFEKWLSDRYPEIIYIALVDKDVAIKYIDFIYIECDTQKRNRKNNVDFWTTVFTWLKNRGYVKKNPFLAVERIKVDPDEKRKIRTPIEKDSRKAIIDFFGENYPGFLYVINYLFVCMIRRTEMTKLRVKDVSLEDQTIFISSTIAKNRRSRFATIPDTFMPFMKKLRLGKRNPEHFLVSKNFTPGLHPIKPKRISTVWALMRKKTGIPKENQFYSLRDTGVIDYLESGVDNKSLKDHADWQSYDMIGVYANHIKPKAIDSIARSGQVFGAE